MRTDRTREIEVAWGKVPPGPWRVLQDPAVSAERRLVVTMPDPDWRIDVCLFKIPYDPARKSLNLGVFGAINDVAKAVAGARSDVPWLVARVRELETEVERLTLEAYARERRLNRET